MLTFVIALALALLSLPLVRALAFRTQRVSQPRQDRWSSRPTPYLGGVAIFAGFILAVLITVPVSELPVKLLIGASLAFVVGLLDDYLTLNPAAKMAGILLSASIMVFGGYTTAFFSSELANIIITMIWIAGIANAFNLVDNMDGLAAGTTLVVTIFLSFIFFRSGNIPLLLITLALAGGTLGFFFFNFPPAKIYMGDGGSLFIGTLLATISIAREPQASNVFAIVAVPAMIFLFPILDTALVSVTRIFRGQSPAQGGRDHTSHRLVLLGLSERQTLFILLGMAFMSGLTAVLVEGFSYALSIFVIPILVLVFALVAAYLGQVKVATVQQSSDETGSSGPERGDSFLLRRRLLEISLDFFLLLFAAFWADVVTDSNYITNIVGILPIMLVMSYVSFYIWGIYRFLWRYIGLSEMIRVLLAVATASLGSYALYGVVYSLDQYAPTYFLAFGVFLFVLLASTRISFRLMGMAFRRARQSGAEAVLLFGAGDAGNLVLRECANNEELGFHVVGFVDDDHGKHGRIILGVPVLGGSDQLAALMEEHAVKGVIVATGRALSADKMNLIMEIARSQGAWVRRFSLEFELL